MLIVEERDSSSVEVAAIFGEDSNNATIQQEKRRQSNVPWSTSTIILSLEIRAAGDMYWPITFIRMSRYFELRFRLYVPTALYCLSKI
jgi:hypothetical protein